MTGDTSHTVEIPHPLQDIFLDTDGIVKFRENRIIASMFNSGKIDWRKIDRSEFSDEDKRQLAMLMGLSVDDFACLPYIDEDTKEQVNAIKMELLSEARKRSRKHTSANEENQAKTLLKLVKTGKR